MTAGVHYEAKENVGLSECGCSLEVPGRDLQKAPIKLRLFACCIRGAPN